MRPRSTGLLDLDGVLHSANGPWNSGPLERPVLCATWLSKDLLLLLGSTPYPWQPNDAELIDGQLRLPLQVRHLGFAMPGTPRPAYGTLVTVPFPDVSARRQHWDRLELRGDSAVAGLGRSELAGVLTDLQPLSREVLAELPPETRADIVEFISEETSELRIGADVFGLSRSLSLLRNMLRERLPQCIVGPQYPHGAGIDCILAVDRKSFFLSGWLWDPEGDVVSVTAVSPEGSSAELLPGQPFRYARPDVVDIYRAEMGNPARVKPGFMSYFSLPAPSHTREGWVVEIHHRDGSSVELQAPQVIREQQVVRDRILSELTHERFPDDILHSRHARPALTRLEEIRHSQAQLDAVHEFGTPAAAPQASVIIPLYGRVDFLEHHMAQFVHDPEMRSADLIYVLDSPELADSLLATAAGLFQLYGVPFRLAILTANGGFARANNLGATLARAPRLVLLNSDVVPDRPGWLGRMAEFYGKVPGMGALGVKLLYEDETIQHAGMYFYKPNAGIFWENQHYYKGLHRCLPAANTTRKVPAVTAACMMIERELYARLDGLRGVYVQGDFEDSDLCLRLIAAGYENWYLPEVELYHLEGQSYPLPLRRLTFQYNRWLHSQLWDADITALMADGDRGSSREGMDL